VKGNVKRKRQTAKQEKILAKDTSAKGPLSKIAKTSSKLIKTIKNYKRANNMIKKWSKDR
jgi:hypothetical protein